MALFKCILLNEKVFIFCQNWYSINNYNKSALVQVMAWHQTGAEPLPEPMLTKMSDDIRHHNELTNIYIHWKQSIVNFTTLLSLLVVIATISSTINANRVFKLTILVSVQDLHKISPTLTPVKLKLTDPITKTTHVWSCLLSTDNKYNLPNINTINIQE